MNAQSAGNRVSKGSPLGPRRLGGSGSESHWRLRRNDCSWTRDNRCRSRPSVPPSFCFVRVLRRFDMSGSCQIEAMLSHPWHGSQVPRIVEELRSLSSRIEIALAMAKQDGAIKKRQQNPETWFFLVVHDLFARLTDNPEPGIAGRLHRFTENCATLIDPRIAVPKSENSFQKRLKAALDRRTETFAPVASAIFPEIKHSD
jgi:hypothetical protein